MTDCMINYDRNNTRENQWPK